MTIYCSLIEFLETTYQGINFKSINNRDLGEFEYGFGNSQNLYTSFLMNRKPFLLAENIAKEFYSNVRCGLLHEAQTTGGWKIRIDSAELIIQNNNGFILNRLIFKKKITQYLFLYKKQLLKDSVLKAAFIRKFDGICDN